MENGAAWQRSTARNPEQRKEEQREALRREGSARVAAPCCCGARGGSHPPVWEGGTPSFLAELVPSEALVSTCFLNLCIYIYIYVTFLSLLGGSLEFFAFWDAIRKAPTSRKKRRCAPPFREAAALVRLPGALPRDQGLCVLPGAPAARRPTPRYNVPSTARGGLKPAAFYF